MDVIIDISIIYLATGIASHPDLDSLYFGPRVESSSSPLNQVMLGVGKPLARQGRTMSEVCATENSLSGALIVGGTECKGLMARCKQNTQIQTLHI